MKILMLGGTRFFGKQAVQALIKRGYEVTIATRGQQVDEFGDGVQRIILDRTDRTSLEKALEGLTFDVVYDNICYAPNEAKALLEVMEGRMGKYIVTSSLAVYSEGEHLTEEYFDPYHYPIVYGNRNDFSYAEGKRLIEAVIYQEFKVPAIAVRFPVVIGTHDYTRRLVFYVEHTYNETPYTALRYDEPMCFITEEEAGEFLALLAEADFVGPINAATNGSITVKEIIEMIEAKAHKKANLVESSSHIGTYSDFSNVTLDCHKAVALGMRFREVHEAFDEVITYDLAHL